MIDNSGNVGIGNSSPTTKLDVNGIIKAEGFQLGISTTVGYVPTADASGVGTWQLASGGSSLWTESSGNVYRNTGNVGVGTAGP